MRRNPLQPPTRIPYPDIMPRRLILATIILALGVIITAVNLRDGLTLSFPLLLGVLLLADGALRFAMLRQDTGDEQMHHGGTEAPRH